MSPWDGKIPQGVVAVGRFWGALLLGSALDHAADDADDKAQEQANAANAGGQIGTPSG